MTDVTWQNRDIDILLHNCRMTDKKSYDNDDYGHTVNKHT